MTLEEAIQKSHEVRSDAWTELKGYVQAAVEEDDLLEPRYLQQYMRELEQRWGKPIRDHFESISGGADHG